MDASEQFVRSEIAVAYTLLWGACLHHEEDDRVLSRLQAKAAYDTAVATLSRLGEEKHRELFRELGSLREAIASWSVEKEPQYRIESYRLSRLARLI